jgi:hypothetical protein
MTEQPLPVQPPAVKRKGPHACIVVALVIAGLIILMNAISSVSKEVSTAVSGTATPEATMTPEKKAWYACVWAVEHQYGVPLTQAERYNPSGIEAVGDDGHFVGIFYAKQNRYYDCFVVRRANGDTAVMHVAPR